MCIFPSWCWKFPFSLYLMAFDTEYLISYLILKSASTVQHLTWLWQHRMFEWMEGWRDGLRSLYRYFRCAECCACVAMICLINLFTFRLVAFCLVRHLRYVAVCFARTFPPSLLISFLFHFFLSFSALDPSSSGQPLVNAMRTDSALIGGSKHLH